MGALAVATFAACRGGPLVIEGGTLIDGTGADPVVDAVVVVEGSRIACADRRGGCAMPRGAHRIDATGFWIVPGLIDARVPPPGGTDPGDRAERLRFLLGVTSARASAGPGGLAGARREALRRGDPSRPLPRLFAVPQVEFSRLASPSAEDAAEIARSPGRAAELVGTPTGGDLPGTSLPPHETGPPGSTRWALYGRAAAGGASYLRPALLGGLEGLVTLDAVWPLALSGGGGEAADRLADELAGRVWLEPELLTSELRAGPYHLPLGLHRLLELPDVIAWTRNVSLAGRMPSETVRLQNALERHRRFVRRFHDAGGTLVVGTGGALAPGLAVHAEIGVADSLGTLVAGKLADALILEGDPTVDIANAQLLSRIVKGGVLHDPSSLFETPLDDPGGRVTPSSRRVVIAFLAMLITLTLAIHMIARHRASRGG